MIRFAVAITLALSVPSFAFAGDLKPGWTPENLASEIEDCTKTLVEGAWDNTKRDQGADPALPMSEEIRKQLGPQIAALKKVCECAVRAGAERYTKAEADKTPADLDTFVIETIAGGTCKLEP